MSPEMSRNNVNNVRYVYDLPFESLKKLCKFLDYNDRWKYLGGMYMNFDCYELDRIGKAFIRKESPTEELLQLWGNQNHTIFELFCLLWKMKHFQAMKVLQPFVDEKYHHLLSDGISRINTDGFEDKLPTTFELTGSLDENSSTNQITRRQKPNSVTPSQDNQRNQKNDEKKSDPSDFNDLGSGIPFINYKELELISTLGCGGFGVVLKGIWKQTAVAIKRLKPQKGNELEFSALEAQRQQLFRELKCLNSYRHDNILPLYGYSVEEDKYCLIYQYMPNGSLEDRIQCRNETKPLSWYARYNIAKGTARGLQFLHSMDKPLVHGDIKSANILLDSNFEAKIGDFGLAREGPSANNTHVTVTRVHGTRPYLPDEFLRGKKFSPKVDTYSFGVVLFEIATGLRAYDDRRSEKFLRDFVFTYDEEKIQELIDTKVGCEYFGLFKFLIELGKKCVVDRPRVRPEMIDVSKQLDGISGDIDSFFRAFTNARLSSANPHRYDPIIRRPSLFPPTGSYHPEQWLFVTPPASNQPISVRRSPSPTNPAATGQGLKQVSEESLHENISVVDNQELMKTPIVEISKVIPDIKLSPPANNNSIQKSIETRTTMISSSRDSSSNSDSIDESDEQKHTSNNDLGEENSPNAVVNDATVWIPMVSLLMNEEPRDEERRVEN